MAKIVVVGGGIGGLSAAYYLREKIPGAEVVLIESSERLGGKIQTFREEGFTLEAGPDAVVRYKPAAIELMKAVGLEGEIVGTIPTAPSALIHNGKEALPIPSGLQMVIPSDFMALATSPLVSPFGKARALFDLIAGRENAEDIPFGDFIKRRLGHAMWENLVAPLTGGIYGGAPEELSTRAAFPQLLEMVEQHGSLIRGAVERRKSAGTREKGQLFASLARGLESWVEKISENLEGVSIKTGTEVSSLEKYGTNWLVNTPQGSIEADAVVLTYGAFQLAPLVSKLDFEASAALSEIPYGHSATISFAFDKKSLPKRVGHGLLIAGGKGFSARGFTWTDQKWAKRAPEEFGVVRAYFSGVEGSNQELTAAALKDLARIWGAVPPVYRAWVKQYPMGLPRYTMGHGDRVEKALRLEQNPGLYVLGAAFTGVGLPEIVRQATERAERIGNYLQVR